MMVLENIPRTLTDLHLDGPWKKNLQKSMPKAKKVLKKNIGDDGLKKNISKIHA